MDFIRIPIIIFLLILASRGIAQTNVGGNITSNVTWTEINSPYIVTDNILVAPTIKLTIEPGVIVKFNSGKRLIIQGTLSAKGTIGKLINFTSNADKPAMGDWLFIELDNPLPINYGNGFSFPDTTLLNYDLDVKHEIEYCSFSFAEKALKVTSATFNVSNSIFKNNNTGISFLNCWNSRIENNQFLSNDNGTLLDYQGRSIDNKFVGNLFKENNSIGLGFSSYQTWSFRNLFSKNLIQDNKGVGMSFQSGNVTAGFRNNRIEENIIYNNLGDGILIGEDPNIITKNIVAKNSGFGINISLDYIRYGLTITNNIFDKNLKSGINLKENNNSIISNNTVISNSLSNFPSIYLPPSYSPSTKNIVSFNTILSTKNNAFEIYYGDNSIFNNNFINDGINHAIKVLDPSIYSIGNLPPNGNALPINATNNYWGTNIETTIQNLIYDSHDDVLIKNEVLYTPFLTSLELDAPILPPKNFGTSTNNTRHLAWPANAESDIAGYKIYFGNYTGYSFSGSIDIGNVNSFTLPDSIDMAKDFAITAYDLEADGINDHFEGHESWFTLFERKTTFTKKPNQPFIGMENSSLDWGDFDRDGDMDLAIMGFSNSGPQTIIYKNDNGNYINTFSDILQLYAGDLKWVDVKFHNVVVKI
jgi:hypothetical protein